MVVSVVGLCCALGGCRPQELRNTYSNEFDCPADKVDVEELGMDRWRAEGCNRSVVYQCIGKHCYLDRQEGNASSGEGSDDAPRRVTVELTAAPQADTPKAKERKSAVVSADVRIGNQSLLKFRAMPEKYGELVQIKLTRLENEETLDDCALEIMLNGQRLQVPKSRFSRQENLSTLLIDVPRSVVLELGTARQLALRACEHRWSLSSEALAEVREFVGRYEEELAWMGDAKKGTTGGLLAPAGGWPDWAASPQPPPVKGAALEGNALFELLSPSVFMIEAIQGEGSRFGSAVAVSTTELVTNCHVLDGARKVIVKQKKREWVARIVRSDPKSDRCVVSVPEQKFVAVRGVRAFSDLKVGEPVFTLGSPSGLELSLSNGILSGVREEDGLKYVQTTAPISPGSSGGGLFDAHGNLVGVTTLVWAGKERLNQALNFAIPADAFFQP